MDGDFTGTDRFVIERQLGAGSMGAVYLAYDRKLESRVALKLLLSVDAANIYRFKKEFRALADVTHRNLVMLHELFSEHDQWFFTMEYVEGKDLLSYVHGGRRRAFDSTPKPISEMPPAERMEPFESPVKGLEMLFPTPLENEERLRGVLLQVVDGLMAVHAAGKLHRDLKPENVLVKPDGRAVLLDFGIVVDQHKDIHETLATIIGTPAYMAPEQCRGAGVTDAVDWYALGVILYEALTGDVPFDGTPMQVISRKQEVDPIPPAEIVSGVPDDLNLLCMQLLQRDPAARPNGDAIARALKSKRAASLPAPAETAAAQRARMAFVGRGAQLRELEGALEATSSGQPVVALVHGPSGIGKTMLVDRFVDGTAEADRAIVLKGRCYERESVPFKAFDNVIDALSRYLRRLPAVDAARMLPREIDALAGLFPVLRRVDVVRRHRRPRALPPDPLEQRQRAFRALKEMFTRIADHEPLAIYVDDMQWSDVDSAKLLGELTTGSDRPALMLILVYRSSDSEHSAGLQWLLERLPGRTDLTVREVPVGVLSVEDSVALARELLGENTEDGARKLGFESGGNPHMLAQLARHVQERRASGLASPETAKGLISFERVLGQRLAALSTDSRTLLELLSVAGRPVPEAILTLVSSFNIDLSTALAELRGAKLVRGVATPHARAVEVYHDAIREAVTAALQVDVLVSWHRRLAAALEASGAMDLEALTDHLLGAGEHERASLYAARAAAQADKGLAFEKAARLYGVAAEYCGDPERKRELQRRWADALVAAGRGSAAAHAYVNAAAGAPEAVATELTALAGAQLLLSGELEKGLALVQEPLAALGVKLHPSLREASVEAATLWQEQRARGFAFEERAESAVRDADLRRLDLLWAVTRGVLLHEVDRPLPLLARYLRDAIAAGEPMRVVRGLALFYVHIDLPFSTLSRCPASGALDVAEAVARRLDQVEARAVLAFAKGIAVYYTGDANTGLAELQRAEELFRNHCRGGAFEMRMSRMVIAHVLLSLRREVDTELLREWIREAEDRGDRVSGTRLRISLAITLLTRDDADHAMAELDAAVREQTSAITEHAERLARAAIHLYRANPDGCRASFYLLDEFFSTSLAALPLWHGLVRLLRARLLLIARAGAGAARDLLAQAAREVDAAEALRMACLAEDVQLLRAAIAAARGDTAAALTLVGAAAAAGPKVQLSALIAERARGQLIGGDEGRRVVARAEAMLRERGVVNARRFARLFLPGLEEVAAANR